MMEYDAEVLREACDNIDLLEYSRSKGLNFTYKSGIWWCSCPRHIDKTPSLAIKENEHNRYHCYSCGSGDDAIQYFRDIEHLSFEQAAKKATHLAHIDPARLFSSPVMNFLRKNAVKQRTAATHEAIDESLLKQYKYGDVPAWRNEGIKQEVLDLFEVGIDERDNRICYPIRDETGKLINIKSRTLYENYKDLRIAKYMNWFPIGQLSYFEGLNITLPDVQASGEIILFESIKSVMKCYGWGIKNTAAVGNHGLTDEQLRLLLKLKVAVVFAYDKDVDVLKDKALLKSIKKLKMFTPVSVIIDRTNLLGAKDSPADQGEDVFRNLYENRRKIV